MPLISVFGLILDKRRSDRIRPPIGVALQMRLREVDELYEEMMGLMSGCPKELRLVQRSGEHIAA